MVKTFKHKHIYLFIIVWLFAVNLSAQTIDTIPVVFKIEDAYLSKSLDALSYLSYVKQTIDTIEMKKQLNNTPEKQPYDTLFYDSLYSARLKNISPHVKIPYNSRTADIIRFYTIQKKEQTSIMLGLAPNYYPLFEKALRNHRLPREFKYLPLTLSALNIRAKTKDGNSGLWLIPYSVTKMYGLQVNTFVDERLVPEKATEAACMYLKEMYTVFNDWTLALTAYVCSPELLYKALKRTNGKTDFNALYPYLPIETRDYIPAFLAMLYLMNHFDNHGIEPIPIDIPQKTDNVAIAQMLYLKQVSAVLHIPYQFLCDINPKYRREIIHPGDSIEVLQLPKNYTCDFMVKKDSIFAYEDSTLYPISPAILRLIKKSDSNDKETSIDDKVKIYYTVKKGDNIDFIAQWYNVRSADIRNWNNITRIIRTGDKIAVYVPEDKVDKYEKIDSMKFDEKLKLHDEKPRKTRTYTPPASYKANDNNYVYYKVRKGDNLWDIAQKFPGVSHKDIMRINNLNKYYKLKIGQVLKIKRK